MSTLARCTGGFMVIVLITGCWSSGESAAQAWIANQREALGGDVTLPALNGVIDTEPVTYNAKGAADPFSPKVALQSRNDIVTSIHGAQNVRFPEASVESLRLVALLRKQGQSVGLVSDGARYENLRKGDFLGREQVEVLSITERGILLRQSDGLERLMKFNQRSS